MTILQEVRSLFCIFQNKIYFLKTGSSQQSYGFGRPAHIRMVFKFCNTSYLPREWFIGREKKNLHEILLVGVIPPSLNAYWLTIASSFTYFSSPERFAKQKMVEIGLSMLSLRKQIKFTR